jgi:hypothetical protein
MPSAFWKRRDYKTDRVHQNHSMARTLTEPWTYRLDGSLQAAGRMQETFDPAGIRLQPIHLENVAGSIYVCLADERPHFDEFRDGLTPLLAPHHLADAKLAHESTLVEARTGSSLWRMRGSAIIAPRDIPA